MAKAANSTALTPWEDPGVPSTEADNALAAEMLGAFHNLDTIQVASGLNFLGLDKGGNWKYGRDNTEPEPGAYWAMDLATARWGWIAWVDGKPAGETMSSIGEQRTSRAELDAGLPWQDQVSIEMVCVSGEDKGTRVLYKTSSVGGVKAFMSYKDACKKIIPGNPGKPIAVVQLDTSEYTNKYGKITNPVLKIAGWASTGILRQDGDGGATAAKPRDPAPPPAAAAAGRTGRRRVAA